MIPVLDTHLGGTIIVTILMMGFAAWTTGRAIAITWRPFWQALLIVSWGWVWATIGFVLTDSAASYWCFYVSFYAAFVLVYAWMVPDRHVTRDQ